MKYLEVCTQNLEQTHALGEKIGRAAQKNMVFLLDGDLGAGKTTLTQGIAKGLDIRRNVTSPTFTILKIYQGRMPLYHIDAYRLEGTVQDLGFEELMEDEGLTVIEWSEYVSWLIPEKPHLKRPVYTGYVSFGSEKQAASPSPSLRQIQ